jgi:hypothetical protein
MHFFEDWTDSEFDDDSDLMVDVASILHDRKTRSTCLSGGAPCSAEPSIWTATGRLATCSCTSTTPTQNRSCTETIFDTIFEYQGSCLGELWKVFASMAHISNARRMPRTPSRFGKLYMDS